MTRIYFEDLEECTICGEQYPARFMERIFFGGAHGKYVCYDCFDNGLKKVDANLYARKIAWEKLKQK